MSARRSVVAMAVHVVALPSSSHEAREHLVGGGRMYSGLHPDHTTSCQTSKAMAMAASFGHAALHTRRGEGRPVVGPLQRVEPGDLGRQLVVGVVERGRRAAWLGSMVVAMAGDLLAQSVGDLGGQRR